MNKQTFAGGVEPGGLRSKKDIKVLICYMLYKVGDMKKQEVFSALQEKGLANYFEVGEAFSELVCNENIGIDNASGKYKLFESGKLISDQLYVSIPISIREQAVASAIYTIKRIKSEEENKVKVEKNEFGYSVKCNISGGDFDLLSFNLYVPDIEQAEKVKENFRKDPESVYYTVLSILTRKKEISADLKNMISNLMN